MVFCCCLLSLFLWLRVSPTYANGWNNVVPKSVVGLSGSCVEIPCTFSYPANGKTNTRFTGIWYTDNYESTVFHTDTSKISQAFKGRTSLTGDLHLNTCSLRISSLRNSDTGPFFFRIEIENLDKYTYSANKVSITVKGSPEKPTVSVKDEVTSGDSVTATCTVLHSCPSDLPRVTWSHVGSHSSLSQPQSHDQWKVESYNLTFTPSSKDHDKNLSCSAEFRGKTVTGYKRLKVKYPPYDVKVVTKSSVRENDSAELTCSSDSNPPANNYQWFSLNGTLLGNGTTYKLEKVSRHTESISCTAINPFGKNSSSPRKLNILYPPEIKSESSCQGGILTVCVCIVDSNPPSEVKWFDQDFSKTFPSSNIKQNEYRTIITMQNWQGLPENVSCFANNSLGNSSITLAAPLNGITIYIAVGSTILVVFVGVLVYVVKRHRGNRATQQPVMKNEMKTIPESKEEKGFDEDIYTNCPDGGDYDNCRYVGTLSCNSALEDESIYANA
ncbi:sialic acid-binding Ig-like lectin 14 isoform X2 [Pimephales promelas]|uniref:sialic acid-binding Ig-like lectin 14 isoform X2 n=1 Tax=Pimephales promelas TaxID=90988 RepID=UPI001955A019|nr:sialic acid-binding Ig-like lectin 14 isoform X2 [Pimephales promelas]